MSATKRVKTAHTRWTIKRDLPAVVEIERAAAEAHGCEPATERQLLGWLEQRNVIGMVVEYGDEVAGHMVYRLERDAVVLLRLRMEPGRGGREELVEKLLYKRGSHRRPILAVPVAAECRTDTVRQLCRAEVIEPAILADALQDADCRDEWLLAELRHGPRAEDMAVAVAHGLNRQV
jgi:hypothetical protein